MHIDVWLSFLFRNYIFVTLCAKSCDVMSETFFVTLCVKSCDVMSEKSCDIMRWLWHYELEWSTHNVTIVIVVTLCVVVTLLVGTGPTAIQARFYVGSIMVLEITFVQWHKQFDIILTILCAFLFACLYFKLRSWIVLVIMYFHWEIWK